MDDADLIDPANEAAIQAEIEKARFAPAATFQDKELWPYTPAARFYYTGVLGPEDLISYRDLAFCYILLKRGGPKLQADVMSIMPVLGSNELFRVAIGEWVDELSGGDHLKADAIFAEARKIREAAESVIRKTQVESRDASPQKKMTA